MITVDNVLHRSEFSSNLLPVSKLRDIDLKITFDKNKVTISGHNRTIGLGKRVANVYLLPLVKTEHTNTANDRHDYENGLELWH